MTKLGRKFIFGLIAIYCVSVVTIRLGYSGEIYIKLVGMVTGIFLTAQTIIDIKKNGKNNT